MIPESTTITSAIVAALTFVGTTGATAAVKKAAEDGYESLKLLLHRKFGAESKAAQALSELEEDPSSEGCRLLLTERLAKVNAGGDAELTVSAQSLLDVIRALPSGEQHIQTVTGSYNAVADRGSMAQVNVYAPPPATRSDG